MSHFDRWRSSPWPSLLILPPHRSRASPKFPDRLLSPAPRIGPVRSPAHPHRPVAPGPARRLRPRQGRVLAQRDDARNRSGRVPPNGPARPKLPQEMRLHRREARHEPHRPGADPPVEDRGRKTRHPGAQAAYSQGLPRAQTRVRPKESQSSEGRKASRSALFKTPEPDPIPPPRPVEPRPTQAEKADALRDWLASVSPGSPLARSLTARLAERLKL